MKKTALFSLVVLLLISCKEKTKNTIDFAKEFQYKMNVEFSDSRTSPLTEEGFSKFKSLDFYPIAPKFRIEADFKKTPNEKAFKMLTTTSRLVDYKKYGEAHFVIDDKPYQLAIYQNVEQFKKDGNDLLFLPFLDLSSGKGSYAGGRYIDLRIPKKDKIIIDFNTAYNPYCAYNHKYSCPIPPSENSLDIAILAGVKKYH